MFFGADSFDQDISTWVLGLEADVSNKFFHATSAKTLDISGHQIYTCYHLEYIKDYDGNLHGNTGSVSDATKIAYKYQGFLDVNADGTKQAIYTNKESGRWVTASIIPITGEIDYSDYGH